MNKTFEKMTDQEIIEIVKNGNKDAFEEIIKRYKNLVFALIHRMTNDYEEANDTAQEIFIRIYKNLDKYDPEYKFSTWIITITTNYIIDQRRKRKQETVPIEDVEFGIAGEGSPEDSFLKAERSRELFSLIDELPEIYKVPLLLYHKDGLSYNEISDRTNESLSKIKNRIFRGRKMLKDKLVKEGDGYGLL